jgi:hypothetical protein
MEVEAIMNKKHLMNHRAIRHREMDTARTAPAAAAAKTRCQRAAKSSRIPIHVPKMMIPMTSGSFRRADLVDLTLGIMGPAVDFACWLTLELPTGAIGRKTK